MNDFIYHLMIVLGIIILLFSVSQLWSGIHNIDILVNHLKWLHIYNKDGKERMELDELYETVGNDKVEIENLLPIGLRQIQSSFFFGITGGILLGISLIGLMD